MNKLQAMREGGILLGELTAKLYDFVQVGTSPKDAESEAQRLIKATGGEPSFARVPRYRWATCININDGVVHGIPESTDPFEDGDMIMLDVGLFYHGHHTDNAFTKVVGSATKEQNKFLAAGREGLGQAIKQVKVGARVGSISLAMETTLKKYGYSPAIGLTGHGISTTLHEDPMIPCFLKGDLDQTAILKLGQTIAIEIIYLAGSPALKIDDDGWTIHSKDGKISAVFEETVEVTNDGYLILTKPALFQRS